jgi:Na+/melibiose symporter-like transporter
VIAPVRLSFATKLSYWFGQLAEGLFNSIFGILLLFYFNQVLGVSASLCGLALFIGTLVDAVTDPMMGTISDNCTSKLGRRHPFMYASALPTAVFLWLLFVPPVQGEWLLFIWLLGFVVLAKLSMTLYHVPHMALGAELTQDHDERTRIVAFRMLFGVAGWILVAIGFANFFAATPEYANGQLNPANYSMFIALAAAGIFVSIVVTSLGTQGIIHQLPVAEPSAANRYTQVFLDLRAALGNESFRWLIISFVSATIPAGIGGAFSLYVNTFYWELSPSQVPLVMMAQFLATLAGYAVAPALGRGREKRAVLVWGVGLWAAATLAPFLLRFGGLFPAPGSDASLSLLVAFQLLAGVGIAQLVVAVSSMMADVADEHELVDGRRNEGVFFGAFAVCTKATAGAGIAVGGVLLDLIAWPTGDTIRTAADVPPETLTQLAVLAGPVVASAAVPFFYCIRHYRIDRKRHGDIRAALSGRLQSVDDAAAGTP